jgi:choline-glycine betaine transporter
MVTSAIGIGIVMVIVFNVTSPDSGLLVIDTITAGGKIEAPVAQSVFWCLIEGLVAIELLLGGGAELTAGRSDSNRLSVRDSAGPDVPQSLQGAIG